MRRARLLFLALPALIAAAMQACAAGSSTQGTGGAGASSGAGGMGSVTTGAGGDAPDGGNEPEPDADFIVDAATEEPPLSPDAACASTSQEAEAVALPVDIIWMVDNSGSMAPAVEQVKTGLNAFAATIAAKNLDYKVIMLSLKSKTSPVLVAGKARYPVCIPKPLAGDDDCGDGPRFFQSSIDIKSTQPLEQFLGTLGQTAGYQPGEDRGGDPWLQELRPNATKTIVVVTDDNARLAATDFETFPGGKNPFNSLTLPPGVLDPSWKGLFTDYVFSGIYGWGSDVDPGVKCSYPDNTQPTSPGPTYTTLVKKTGGVRAKICDGPAAWQPFFDAVAQAVISSAKLSCELTIPTPQMGTLDPTKINVAIGAGQDQSYLVGVDGAGDCGADLGWYYDDPQNPTKVLLCPAACDAANAQVGPGKPGKIEVIFGCETILK